ncbi:MAG: glycine cleavage T C-terminal barrel domain-containing protein, partial [Flavicella sp.]|nr:glycine cleavage T C-terminal barrel domain-containing protein [Flavicella sp.]
TKFSKKFTNSEALLLQKESGVSKKLIGFELLDKGVPRHGYEITDVEGKPIGRVTSGTMGPTVKKGIGMGYVPSAFSKAGSEICIRVRKRLLKAQVVKTPFYRS